MLMRVACAYIEGADVRAVASLDGWQSSPCASLSSMDAPMLSSTEGGSSSDASGSSGRDPTAAVAVVDPRRALDTAHKLTKLPGSATACVLQLCPEKRALICANLVRAGAQTRAGSWVLGWWLAWWFSSSSRGRGVVTCPWQTGCAANRRAAHPIRGCIGR